MRSASIARLSCAISAVSDLRRLSSGPLTVTACGAGCGAGIDTVTCGAGCGYSGAGCAASAGPPIDDTGSISLGAPLFSETICPVRCMGGSPLGPFAVVRSIESPESSAPACPSRPVVPNTTAASASAAIHTAATASDRRRRVGAARPPWSLSTMATPWLAAKSRVASRSSARYEITSTTSRSITTKRTAHGDLSRGSFPCARPLALAAMPDTMDVDGKAPPDGKVSRASQTCARIPSGGIVQRGCA